MKPFKGIFKVIAVFMFLLCQVVTSQVWEEIGINLPEGDTASHYIEITFANENIGWLYTRLLSENEHLNKLYRTTDGGKSWKKIENLEIAFRSNISLYSTEPDFFYIFRNDGPGSTQSDAYYTTDGGNSWDHTTILENLGYGFAVLYFLDDKRGIAFGSHSMVTTDGGKTWEKKGEIAPPIDVYFYNDKIGWAIGYSPFSTDAGYIAKTTDGCETWEYQEKYFGEQVDYHGIEFIDSLKGFAVRGAVAKTIDGGSNWMYVSDSWGFDVGFLDNKNGWITGVKKIFRTTDGGETWELQYESNGNYFFTQIIISKKDKAAFVLGLNDDDNTATLLKADLSSITGIEENKKDIPEKYNLEQNYPNPFNPATNISYQIPVSSYVTLSVYDVLGREIAVLVNEEKKPGSYKVSFNAGGYNLTSGVYFYRIQTGDYSQTRKLVLQK